MADDKRTKVLAIVQKGKMGGLTASQIADELNNAGYKRTKGRKYRASHIYQLTGRTKGLTTTTETKPEPKVGVSDLVLTGILYHPDWTDEQRVTTLKRMMNLLTPSTPNA